ncbi:16S rRNA (guanine(966)-N(2))-methyltransferase RsmD [Marilutibacter aestuarii]|uniref:16S rRNA (Guanine(966)-N(2))-methyltransferase RsmD n=1 Tax=Marilutibacter aestuarii TaxID=1706195 RepID=A0A508A461_9GAMM|nr:16S rRNA (guanine(966)-N(2))-methyltransferase RsmD [Lysobacter aestuarii]TQD43541.1 16S rRNA (guanine(966)-N(2))-methyltransferase RsmD [Lysobacter aestuarii]
MKKRSTHRRPPPSSAAAAPSATTGKVRLIGGRWRGTRLPVPAVAGLRPTADRVRETLFNWLMPALPGARVLDLFAGSGALGLEAVSRGAASAVLVERDRGLAHSLRETVDRLEGGEAVRIVEAEALGWLQGQAGTTERFDIAFVDPPFAAGLWDAALAGLPALMADTAWLYVESPADHPPAPPAGWSLHREGRTRESRQALYRRQAVAAAKLGPFDPPGPDVSGTGG